MNGVVKVRERFSMDKDWKFHLGDLNISPGKKHTEVYHFAKAGNAVGPAGINYDDNGWRILSIPHDWSTELDFDENERPNFGYKARGIAWYRKCFKLDEKDKNKQIIIEFDGMSANATIYFNGSVIERNFTGYNSFSIDISDRIFTGDKTNVLSIRIDASLWEGWWYEGAGIYRHVHLTKKSSVHIAHFGTWVNPKRNDGGEQDINISKSWSTDIETMMENSIYSDEEFTLKSILIDLDGNKVGSATDSLICKGGERLEVKQSIEIISPMLWDIDTPHLYTLVSEVYDKDGVLVDIEETTYGYRTIRICPDTGFYLNDRPLKLMGTCNHQDHAGIGVALPDSIHEYRIRRLKEMGSNAYRCAHNNPAPEILRACDRMGMLVMDENRNFEASSDVIRQVESMVKRDRNHPSVIMYSIFNEEPLQGTTQGRGIAKRLMHTIKRLDNTRPVLGALNGGVMEDEGTSDILDITGVNYQLGVFDEFHAKHPKQPIVASESASAFSTRGIYKTDLEKHVFDSYDIEKAPWGATIRENWETVNTRDYIMGTFIWTGFDYLGEPTPFIWPSVSTAFGIMDTCGFAKDAFHLYKAYWTKEPMVHILPHWNWKGSESEIIKVMTHTNCEEVELFLNSKSLGKKPIPVYEQAEWGVPYEPGILEMKGYIGGIVAAEASTETTKEAVALIIEPDRDWLYGDGLDAMPVNVSAVDEKGRFVPIANNKVKFSILGDGRIMGVGNGDPNSHEPYISNERCLFSGRCQAIIQSLEINEEKTNDINTNNNVVTIIAEAEGLASATVSIEIKTKRAPQYIESTFEQYLSNWRMTQELSSERPDVNVKILDSDMNSWEPVDIDKGAQKKFYKKVGLYALYRAAFEAPTGENKHKYLQFNGLQGHVEIYINGEKCSEGDYKWVNEVKAYLPANMSISGGEKVEVTVLIQSLGDEAGICKSVILR